MGTPIDILIYQLNGKYITIDPITDFKMGNIPTRYTNAVTNLITEQLKLYLNQPTNIHNINLVKKIRDNYNIRLKKLMVDELETALFFSMVTKEFSIINMHEFNDTQYTSNSYNNQSFTTFGSFTNMVDNENLNALNFMMAGYLLADELENIIFPKNPKFVNSNEYIKNEDNYDRLFNCLYFNEKTKKFLQKKISKNDISRKYVEQNILDIIPKQYLEFNSMENTRKELLQEFNLYLKETTYFNSMYEYINSINVYEYVKINDMMLKTCILVFIKNYDDIIYDKNDKPITKIGIDDIRTLKYQTNKIEISKHHLRFNLILFDDVYLHQMIYQNNNSKTKINLIKNNHITNLIQYLNNNN